MDISLEPQSFPIAIAEGFTEKGESTIIMQCHDRVFQRITVLDLEGDTLFTAESKGIASFSWRRTVKDASGRPLFHLRKVLGYVVALNKWIVESPNGEELCTVKHASMRNRQLLDVLLGKGNEDVVQVRPKDQSALTTLVYVKGAPVAEIQMTEVNAGFRVVDRLDRSVWRARIAGGVDHVLIVAIMLCRAEAQHVWKQ